MTKIVIISRILILENAIMLSNKSDFLDKQLREIRNRLAIVLCELNWIVLDGKLKILESKA